jgi:hypothetical protein
LAINIIFAVLVGFFEMPFCCTCITFCAKIADKLKFLENYLARGILYSLSPSTRHARTAPQPWPFADPPACSAHAHAYRGRRNHWPTRQPAA